MLTVKSGLPRRSAELWGLCCDQRRISRCCCGWFLSYFPGYPLEWKPCSQVCLICNVFIEMYLWVKCSALSVNSVDIWSVHMSSCRHLGCGRRYTLRSSNYKMKFVRATPKWNKICKVIHGEALVFSRSLPSLPGCASVCAVVAAILPPLKVAGQPRDLSDPGQCPAAKAPERCHSV